VAALFFVLAAGLALSAAAAPLGGALALGWGAASLALAGVAYLGFPGVVFGKDGDSGRLPIGRKLLLLPYLLLSSATWHALRLLGKEPPWDALGEGVFIGRRLLPGEYPAGVRTVVDLTWEFEERLPPGPVRYLNWPILDAAGVSPEALRAFAARLLAEPHPLYLHCAQGHGRTGMVAAALLLAREPGETPEGALARVRAARPGVRLGEEQRAALVPGP
jgi:hypothetical protein